MSYPKLANWIRFKKVSENEYIAKNLLSNTEYKLSAYAVWFIRQLDGQKDPHEIDKNIPKNDCDMFICRLRNKDIIRDKRFLSKSLLDFYITLWQPKIGLLSRVFSFFINLILLVSFLPMLVFSLYYFINNINDLSGDYILIGSYFGLFAGMFFHEFGHILACLANGGRVFEMGIGFHFFLPCAYVLLNSNSIKSRLKRVQVSAAGIEMNFLLASIFLIMSVHFYEFSGFLLGAAVNNAFLALINLSFANGFDGMAIMQELLGIDGLVDKAKQTLSSEYRRRMLRNKGISGKAVIAVFRMIKVIQIVVPLLIAVNILGVVLWFR
ncbi:MAG: M50 family metallopeptidase [Faecalibacterium sp.]|nr:M50 family metallopeptidase [Ruminococcus sp.]MCM1392365.1 M50 family metallopeptidase [Ruminococcus sp.]MCM1485154.1 M50 family metallopeptidase [Faecalibacterium sp.]